MTQREIVLKVVRIIVASPGDVQAERDTVEEVAGELNRSIARQRGLYLEVSRWETDTYPGFNVSGPQGLIDSILHIEECDLLIGIFWKRFGTPVMDAQSGTEHEFRIAYETWKQRQRPQIMVYFNQKAYAPRSPEEANQWGQVLAFQRNFPKEGLWWTYNGKNQFEKVLQGHLTRFILNQSPRAEPPSAAENTPAPPDVPATDATAGAQPTETGSRDHGAADTEQDNRQATSSILPDSLEPSIVRIRDHSGKVVGAGFLASPNHVITCAHVVARALGASERDTRPPTADVTLDFPLVAPQQLLKASVVAWRPVGAPPPQEDIAVLELQVNPPKGAVPTVLRNQKNVFGHGLQVFGFPDRYDMGVWGIGQARAGNAYGWLQIGDPQSTGYFIKPGFSGAPVWDEDLQGVIGMVVATDKTPNVREAWIIPTATLQALLPTGMPPVRTTAPLPIQPPGAAFDPDWYVPRAREERQALINVSRGGAPANIWGPRSFGKTWFLRNILRQLRQQDSPGCRIVLVNLYEFQSTSLDSFSTFLQELAVRIVLALGRPDTLVSEVWDRPGTPNIWMTILMDRILRDADPLLILALDKADALFGRPVQDDFFGLLRAWAEKSEEPPWDRLRLLTAASTTPAHVATSVFASSYFNLTSPIRLSDLDEKGVRMLADRYGLRYSQEDIALLMQLVGGHPYLLRLPMSVAALERTELRSLLEDTNLEDGVFGKHLIERLYWLQQHPELADAVRKVLTNPKVRLDPDTYAQLQRAGYLDQVGGSYRLPYKLYADYLRGRL